MTVTIRSIVHPSLSFRTNVGNETAEYRVTTPQYIQIIDGHIHTLHQLITI
jgi:hypothetical protein